MKNVAIGADHAGYSLKVEIVNYLQSKGYNVLDKGTDSEDSMDYPDTIHPVAKAVDNHEVDFGIIMCGSGQGAAMTANKYPGVRAALAWIPEIAELAKLHNNANILDLPARFVTKDDAFKIVDAFLDTEFEGGRHQRRVDKIAIK